MAVAPPKPLDVGELINNANETVYTVPSNVRTLITAATAKNVDASTTVTLTVWLGAAASDATERMKIALLPEESTSLTDIIGQSLQAAESIIMVGSSADLISVRITGTEFAVT